MTNFLQYWTGEVNVGIAISFMMGECEYRKFVVFLRAVFEVVCLKRKEILGKFQFFECLVLGFCFRLVNIKLCGISLEII